MDRFYAVVRNGDRNSIAARLVLGTSSTAFLKLFNSGAVFVTAVLLGRFLGVEQFGIYAYALSWITLLAVFARLGINTVIVRNIAVYHKANDWSRILGIFRFGFLVVTVGGLLCAAVLVVAAWLLHSDAPVMRTALWLACIPLLLEALLVPLKSAQGGFQQITYAQLPLFFVTPATFLLLVVGAYTLTPASLTGSDTILLRAAAIGMSLLVAVKLLRLGLKNAGRPQSLPRPVYHPREWLTSAAPMILVGSMFIVNSNADILMLGSIIGAEASGVYKAATRGAELVAFSLMVVNFPLGPLIARLHAADDRIRLQRALTHSAWVAFLPAIVLAALFILKGEWFLQLFGPEFASQEGSMSLAILSVGQLVNVAAGAVAILLVMTKHEAYAARAMTIGAVLNITLNAILIPIAGLIGAAIATGISTIVWNILLVSLALRHLNMNPTIAPLHLFGSIKKI